MTWLKGWIAITAIIKGYSVTFPCACLAKDECGQKWKNKKEYKQNSCGFCFITLRALNSAVYKPGMNV